jgi:hypothetical protein
VDPLNSALNHAEEYMRLILQGREVSTKEIEDLLTFIKALRDGQDEAGLYNPLDDIPEAFTRSV